MFQRGAFAETSDSSRKEAFKIIINFKDMNATYQAQRGKSPKDSMEGLTTKSFE
jgi:hypothetical protein